MREDRQLHTILNILKGYSTKEPLSRYLKNYFRAHKEMGSRDRRQASDFIYSYYRLGRALSQRSPGERLAVGNYLCADSVSPLLQFCVTTFLQDISFNLQDGRAEKISKIKSLFAGFDVTDIFPLAQHISGDIDKELFLLSHLQQPHVWIRIRRKFLKSVTEELTKENISFKPDETNPLTLSFANGTKLDKLKSYEKGYFEIQDWSSQQTANYFKPKPNEHWWDACAGSGGKSLLLHDMEPSVHITVSDARESIFGNLKQRFDKARISGFETFQSDLTNLKLQSLNIKPLDGIIADVPCSGSGTWGRTPEWLSMFDEKDISKYSALQKKIVSNIVPYLKSGHPILYITCSVFKEENEDVIEWMKKEFGLAIESAAYIKGYERGGDTMFVARLVN